MRIFSLAVIAVFALTACPKKDMTDGGTGGGGGGGMNPPPKDACSGACGPLEKCDTASRQCVDACGGCTDGGTCTKTGDTFACMVVPVVCNGTTCAEGQIACFGGECSCIKGSNSQVDSCNSQGMICDGQACQAPIGLQQCKQTGAPCPQGYACQPVFGDPMDPNATFLCTKNCGGVSGGTCDLGDLCFNIGCLPNGFASGFSCGQFQTNPDGGAKIQITVPVGNVCLQRDNMGNPTEQVASGNCTYTHVIINNQGLYAQPTCRPPGSAADAGDACKDDYRSSQLTTICGTNLECALTSTDTTGVCLQMCNAAPVRFGIQPKPDCGMGNSCVNLYRQEATDENAVLGVCMKSCNVFDSTSTCAPTGITATSCVPTDPLGFALVSLDGSGICSPQNTSVAALDAPCDQTDPFKGAACNSNQVCATLDPTQPATCHAVCDTACIAPNPPARCQTEANSMCASGKTCTKVTSTTGAYLGFCE